MHRLATTALLGVLLTTGGLALASPYERVPPVAHERTRKECGECHMAFQPALLPAAGWNRIMDGLADHFGDNAKLAPDVAADIRAYLTANAGRSDGDAMRITEQPWWVREHRRVRPETWAKPDVRSKANCEACHRDAARGLYEDD